MAALLQVQPKTKYLLGYNEPDVASQANINATVGAQGWYVMEQVSTCSVPAQLAPSSLRFGGLAGRRVTTGTHAWAGGTKP